MALTTCMCILAIQKEKSLGLSGVTCILQGLESVVVPLDIDTGGEVDFICRKKGKYFRTRRTVTQGRYMLRYLYLTDLPGSDLLLYESLLISMAIRTTSCQFFQIAVDMFIS